MQNYKINSLFDNNAGANPGAVGNHVYHGSLRYGLTLSEWGLRLKNFHKNFGETAEGISTEAIEGNAKKMIPKEEKKEKR